MATSGSSDFSLTRNDIIIDALETVGVYEPGEPIDPSNIESASRKLNMMIKAWMARGINLWLLQESTLFLAVGTASYLLGSTGTHCTNSYVQTTLSTDEALGSTSIGLTSASGMTASDKIGIVLDDGTIHWTTISGSPGSTTTIALGLASAASSGNIVFAYTTKINRPLRVHSAYRRNISDNDTPIDIASRKGYADLPNKSSQGKTNQIFYDRQLGNGVLYAWPTPDIATDVLRFWNSRPVEDFDAISNSPDFPIEWGEALSYGLADRLAPTFGLSLAERQLIKSEAAEKLAIAMNFDQEDTSVFFQPDVQ